jgi:hypothetical protein
MNPPMLKLDKNPDMLIGAEMFRQFLFHACTLARSLR